MNNEERLKFLKQKPSYSCIPGWSQHEIGCPCKNWSAEDLQQALDMAKRSMELELEVKNIELRKKNPNTIQL